MSNVNVFRRYAHLEDQMIRASMPLTSAADLPTFTRTVQSPAARVWHDGHLIAAISPLTFSLGSVVSNV